MIMVKAFPARKMQDVLIIMAIVFVVVLYFLFRFLQPEQLFNPDIFHGFTEYFATLQAPDSSLLPTTWAKVALASGTSIQGIANQGTFYFLMMLSNGLMAILVGSIIADRIYFDAYSKSQEGGSARFTTSKRASAFFNSLVRAKGSKRRQLMVKDIRTFFRETTQWTQLLLLSALVVVYLFNYKVLHLERYAGMTFYLRNIISFVNVILAGFVMSAICVRFVLPAVSVEGRAFWILRTAPIKMSYFLWSKFFLYVIPIFIVSEVLIVVSNIFLKTSGFLMIVTSIAMAFCSLGICAIAVGVGAMYPNFEEKNVARMSTGASSIIYMVISIGFMLTIFTFIALPSYIWQIHILSKTLPTTIDWAITGVMLFLSMLVIAAAIYFPMKMGVRALETRED
jgi:ABC-2 type transport system permease protein